MPLTPLGCDLLCAIINTSASQCSLMGLCVCVGCCCMGICEWRWMYVYFYNLNAFGQEVHWPSRVHLPFCYAVTHEQLKERSLFGLPPPPGTNPADYYHLMANHRSPYGELLMQTGAAAAATAVHLPDYISPVDSEYDFSYDSLIHHV